MTLKKIIEIADTAYGDGLIGLCAKGNTRAGDTLALFIARELRDTYDPESTDIEQLRQGQWALLTAYDEIGTVIDAFENAIAQAIEEDPCQD